MSELLEGVEPVWESDRYDVPLGGHAWYNGEYGTFSISNMASWGKKGVKPRYSFYRAVDASEARRLMAQRQLFEDMVGHHCTYRVRTGYDPNLAIDFDGFYGRKAAKHPYRDEQEPNVEYVGDFIFPRPKPFDKPS